MVVIRDNKMYEYGLTLHVLSRINSRGISPIDIQKVLCNGERIEKWHPQYKNEFRYIYNNIEVITKETDNDKIIITAYKKFKRRETNETKSRSRQQRNYLENSNSGFTIGNICRIAHIGVDNQ